MKCPHCGIYYMDGEKECPVCGKRPGIMAPKKKSIFDMPAPSTDQPKAQKVNRQKNAVRLDEPAKPKKKRLNLPLIIFGIIFFLFAAVFVVSLVISITESIRYEIASPEPESVYESCELDEILPSGTWETVDGSMRFVTHADGSISWTDGTETATDSNPMLDRVNLTEENAPDFCSEYELENYPVSAYTHYNLWFYDASTDLPEYDLCVYLLNESAPEEIAQFDCYDRITETNFTLYLMSDA